MEPWVYIVLVGAVAIVYVLRLPARTGKEDSEKKSLKETEAALELYMADIEHENSELLKLVGSIKTQSQSNKVALQEEIGVLREQVGELQRSLLLMDTRLTAEEKDCFSWLPPSRGKLRPAIQRSPRTWSRRLRQYLRLSQGPSAPLSCGIPGCSSCMSRKSIDSIAKTAGLQRGEVQLILQLAQQEESV